MTPSSDDQTERRRVLEGLYSPLAMGGLNFGTGAGRRGRGEEQLGAKFSYRTGSDCDVRMCRRLAAPPRPFPRALSSDFVAPSQEQRTEERDPLCHIWARAANLWRHATIEFSEFSQRPTRCPPAPPPWISNLGSFGPQPQYFLTHRSGAARSPGASSSLSLTDSDLTVTTRCSAP